MSTAITLTGRSERTLWRWVSEGIIKREDGFIGHKIHIFLDSIIPHLCIALDQGDADLILQADAGDAQAQADLASIFQMYGHPESARYWLNLAAERGNSEAMRQIALTHLRGDAPQDGNLAVMWLAKAAAHGSLIAQAQMSALLSGRVVAAK